MIFLEWLLLTIIRACIHHWPVPVENGLIPAAGVIFGGRTSDLGLCPIPCPAVGLLLAVQSHFVPAAEGCAHLVLLEELILNLALCLSFPSVSAIIGNFCDTVMHIDVCQ